MRWRRGRSDGDFAAEIRAHLQLEAEELVREGIPRADADAASRRVFGNVAMAHERFHESQGFLWFERLHQDVRYALRQLRRAPAFTSAALLTLALGIALTTTMFSVVSAMLLHPVPYPDPNGLAVIFRTDGGRDNREWVPASDLMTYRTLSRSFTELAAYYQGPFTLEDPDGAELLRGAIVTTNSFRILGERPLLGRDFRSEEDMPGRDLVVILGWDLWKERFGGDPGVIGQVVTLNGKQRTIVGVMKPGFQFPEMERLWVPAAIESTLSSRDYLFVAPFGRLASGVSIAQASREIAAIARRIDAAAPARYAHWAARVDRFRERIVSSEYLRTPFLLLLSAAGLVLLLACANIAHLQLVRGLARRRELALRSALGARRGRLARQLITESLFLSMAGGGAGVGLSVFFLKLIVASIPTALPNWLHFVIDARVLVFALLASLASGIVFGVAPALNAATVDPNVALKEGGRTSSGARPLRRHRGALVVLELSLSLVLLVTAMLTMQSFLRLTRSKLGFDSHGIATASVALAGPHYDSVNNRIAFFDRVLEQLAARPGMTSVAGISYLPSRGGSSARIEAEGHPASAGDAPVVMYNVVAGDFFGTMRIPVLLGRTFGAPDWTDSSSSGVVVNQTMATQLWPHESAIGHRVRIVADTTRHWFTVIGVVGDIAQDEIGAPEHGEMFRTGKPGYSMSFVARTDLDTRSTMIAIREEVSSVDPRVPVYDFSTLDLVISRSESVWIPRLYGIMFGSFACVAFLLAIVGVSGVVAFDVRQRRNEIGLRVALGAAPMEVMRLVLMRVTTLALIGIAMGVGVSLAAGRVLRGLLFGISASDPVTLIAVPLALLATVLVASYFPARLAGRVDPSLVLRED